MPVGREPYRVRKLAHLGNFSFVTAPQSRRSVWTLCSSTAIFGSGASADLSRELAHRFGALRKLLAAEMAGFRDVIDDAVEIHRPRQRRPRMAGLAAGSAFRLAAPVEHAFLLFLFGRRFRESVARRRHTAVAAEQIRTAFEFSDPLLQGCGQFPQLPILDGGKSARFV